MENPSFFDLNEAIRRWRERLIALRSFGADDLEELENHLRESVAELQTQVLSIEAAFLVATERLGSDRELAEEYAKTNAKRIWTARTLWMLGGVVVGIVTEALIRAGTGFVFDFSERLGFDGRLIVTLGFFTRWTICAAGIGLGCWLVPRGNRWLVRTVTKCFQRPVWTGVGLLLGLLTLQISVAVVNSWHWHHPDATPSPSYSNLRAWIVSAMVLNRLACIAAIPLLAAYLWKPSRAEAGSGSARTSDSLEPNERALTRQLEAQGLSRSEANLVVAWQRGFPAVASETKVRGTWLECVFWMIVGMVANWMLQDFLDRPSWMLVHSNRSSPMLWQHFSGLLSMCLPLTLVGAAITFFWKGATGRKKRKGLLGRLFAESQLRCAIWFATLAVLWVGLTACLFLGWPAEALGPNESHGQIGIIWWTSRVFLNEFLLPVILLVWAGNRWYDTSRKSARTQTL